MATTPQQRLNARLSLARFRELGIVVFLALVVVAASVKAPRFLSPANLRDILLGLPLIVVGAIGMTLVILTRNIDLSVGAILGVAGMIVGLTFKRHADFPILPAFLMGMALGAALGAVNGALVTWMRVPAIITTLGTLSMYRGITFMVSGGSQVDPNDIPTALTRLSQTSPIGLPWLVIYAAAIAAVAHLFLRYHRRGRALYAIGGNPAAARLSGIAVDRSIFLVFTMMGLLAGLAGVMYASRFGSVNPGQAGVGYELSVIAAAVIGGTDVFGGVGSIPGTLLGCLLLAVVNNALPVTGLSAQWQLATYGLIILLGVCTDAAIRRSGGAGE